MLGFIKHIVALHILLLFKFSNLPHITMISVYFIWPCISSFMSLILIYRADWIMWREDHHVLGKCLASGWAFIETRSRITDDRFQLHNASHEWAGWAFGGQKFSKHPASCASFCRHWLPAAPKRCLMMMLIRNNGGLLSSCFSLFFPSSFSPQLPSSRFRFSSWHRLQQCDVTGDQLTSPRVREGLYD